MRPRADEPLGPAYASWRLATEWIATSGEIAPGCALPHAADGTHIQVVHRPAGGRQLEGSSPGRTFDCRMVAACQRALRPRATNPAERWFRSLGQRANSRIRALAQKYDAQYVLTYRWPRLLKLDIVYANRYYVIYRIEKAGRNSPVERDGARRAAGTSPGMSRDGPGMSSK